jgi:hypothetical protein
MVKIAVCGLDRETSAITLASHRGHRDAGHRDAGHKNALPTEQGGYAMIRDCGNQEIASILQRAQDLAMTAGGRAFGGKTGMGMPFLQRGSRGGMG